MLFALRHAIFYYFIRPFIAFCGLIALFGYITGKPIEPMIAATVTQATHIAANTYQATQQALPILIDKASNLDLDKVSDSFEPIKNIENVNINTETH